MNGVKIAVPVGKMSVSDLEYVEQITGVSLDDDKPASAVRHQKSRKSGSMAGAGASIERPKAQEYDWFQFFLSCDVAVGLCERYAQTFLRDSMDESVLPDVDATVLRTLGLREGDIIKVMRFLDKKFVRSNGNHKASFGGDEAISPSGEGSSLFSGPGGGLRNNTRKGRPAPAIHTNDKVDAKAFSQGQKQDQDHPSKVMSDDTGTSQHKSPPVPPKNDVHKGGFEDDAWDVKPSAQTQQLSSLTQSQASAPSPAQKPLIGALDDLSLLTPALEPTRAPESVLVAPSQAPQPPQPQPVVPSIFDGIGGQQTGLSQMQTGQQQSNTSFQLGNPIQTQYTSNNGSLPQQSISRARPVAPPSMAQNTLMPAPPPARPLSAPQHVSSFIAPPPLQPQMTGYPSYQSQVAPPGQSMGEISQQRQMQQLQQMQQQQQQQQRQQQAFQPVFMPQATGFNPMQNSQPVVGQNLGFQQMTMPTGINQQQFSNGTASPFADPRPQQFSPSFLQPQATGFQSSFPSQINSQATGVNAFLPPAMQPQRTAVNGAGSLPQGFNIPTPPPIPQNNIALPLIPQKTGPPPPGLSRPSLPRRYVKLTESSSIWCHWGQEAHTSTHWKASESCPCQYVINTRIQNMN